MNQVSEGTSSSQRINAKVPVYPTLTMPTRLLHGLDKPLRYTNAASTDIRRTLDKFRRLERMRGAK